VRDVRDWNEGSLNILDFGLLQAEDVTPGAINRKSAAAAREYIVAAAKATLNAHIVAMVTLPVNKEATQLSDPGFIGHTELIGAVCGVSDVTIMLVSDQLIVTHVTTHVSLAAAIAGAKQARIKKIIGMTVEAVCKLRDNPRIAVAGLNPHAGENGLSVRISTRFVRRWSGRRRRACL
jgi:4-hydroxythreonine-4-phosphate dehydrogenase